MKTAICFWITLLATCATESNGLPALGTGNRQSLISFLLQAPPVVEAACYIRDVNSAGVIVDKVCDCNGTTVHCNVGPITVGDIELTFCNKKPSQPIDDLLFMKFACDSSDPACGEGTACDIGPIEYDNNKYYLCTDQTGILPPAQGGDICVPSANRTGPYKPPLPGEPGSQKATTTTAPEEPKTTTTSEKTTTTTAPGEQKTTTTSEKTTTTTAPEEPKTTTTSEKTTTTTAPEEPKTTRTPRERKTTSSPREPPTYTWRPWRTPTWVLPTVNPPIQIPTLPPVHRPWPPMGWGHGPWWRGGDRGFRFRWHFGHGPRWHDDEDAGWFWGARNGRRPWGNGGRQPWDDGYDDDDERPWNRDARLPCRRCPVGWDIAIGRHRSTSGDIGVGGFRRGAGNTRARAGWPWNQRGRAFSSESSSSSSDGWW